MRSAVVSLLTLVTILIVSVGLATLEVAYVNNLFERIPL